MLRCPQCGYEYMPGRTMCPDCQVSLEDSQAANGHSERTRTRGKKMEEVIPVIIYRAQGQLEANVVKAKLESEGIPAILQYESAGVVYGMTFDGLGEVRVLVPGPLQAAAHEVLNEARFRRPDFEHSPSRHSNDDDEDEDEDEHGEHAEEEIDDYDDDEEEGE